MKKMKWFFVFAYITGLLILILSMVLSGHRFQFNGDELFNANIAYLMLKGFRPYTDFYMGYSPFIHWLLSPLFMVFGFTFEAVSGARIFMICLFFLKVFLLFILVNRIFGRKLALIFLALYLLNPFVVFTEMQVRPDNLMMFFYTIFLLLFSSLYKSHSPRLFILLGGLYGLTFLTHMKIAPSLGAFGLVFFLYTLKQKTLWRFVYFLSGSVIVCFVFFSYFLIQGSLREMLIQLFVDTFRIYNRYITSLGYFYFTNPVLYGHEGKPMTWLYSWALPVMAFVGGYHTLTSLRKQESTSPMKVILVVSLLFQWTSLLFVNSVFLQYYIPINWLYTLFSAIFIESFIIQFKPVRLLQIGFFAFFLVLLILLWRSNLQGNLARAKMTDDAIVREMKEYWEIIPEDQVAYPNVLFRKPIYPLLWGQVISDNVRDRYPPVFTAIEKHRLKTLTGVTEDFLSYLDIPTQNYIRSNYEKDPANERIWRRKN